MTLESQVTSLKLSQRLQKLGFPQKSLFQYEEYFNAYDGGLKDTRLLYNTHRVNKIEIEDGNETVYWKYFSAYSVAELGERLPKVIDDKDARYNLRMWAGTTGSADFYSVAYESWGGSQRCCQTRDTEAEARGEMLAYLKENNLI